MTPAQCRAARALLDWSQKKLADEACVGYATIRNFEKGRHAPQRLTLFELRRALEAAGVIFVEGNGEGPGVRVRRTRDAGPEPSGPATEAVQEMDAAIKHNVESKRELKP